jgi:hypothetical protein
MNRTLWVAPLALSLALAACSDLLTEDPKTFLTDQRFYKTPADIRMATLAAYEPLNTDQLYDWWLWLTMDLASDQVRMHPDEPNYGTYHPEFLLWDGTTSSVTAPWNGFYDIIFRANRVIARAPQVQFTDPAEQATLIAEAKFLRGYAHLVLTKLYGDVPLLVSEADHANLSVARTQVAPVHAQVVKDLTEAEAALPATRPAAELGRATKGAAQMALADLYQWRSSALGSGEWQQASDWAQKVIDSGRYNLTADYLATFLPANKGNSEMIFMIVATGLDGRTSTNLGCLILPRALGFNSGGGCEVLGQPTLWHYNSYLTGDYRWAVTYRTGGCSLNPSVGCVTFNWPNVHKYRPTRVVGPSDTDFPLYRYAEAILMYAEAQNELGNTVVAVAELNKIRARARKGTGGENRPEPHDYGTAGEPMDQASVRAAIYMERNWELAHEGKRWFDLVRRDAMEPDSWVTSLRDHDPIDPKSSLQRDLRLHRKRWPLPQSELQLNRSLTQNLGY